MHKLYLFKLGRQQFRNPPRSHLLTHTQTYKRTHVCVSNEDQLTLLSIPHKSILLHTGHALSGSFFPPNGHGHAGGNVVTAQDVRCCSARRPPDRSHGRTAAWSLRTPRSLGLPRQQQHHKDFAATAVLQKIGGEMLA